MDPSQHTPAFLPYVIWTVLFALADFRLSRLDVANGEPARFHRMLVGPVVRVGVRAGLAFGLFGVAAHSGLSAPMSAIVAIAGFLVLTLIVGDRLAPAVAPRRYAESSHPGVGNGATGDRPAAALSVIASRAKRLEYVPASRLMVPRRSIVGCDSSATVEEAASLMRETGLSRIIAYSKNLDRPLGLAHIRDVLPKVYGKAGHTTVESILRPLVLVPTSTRALDLLRDFQRLKRRIAIIRDLQGERTLGLVSTEDILEELVGEIHDEHEDPLLSALDSGVALVRADLKVKDLLRGLGASIEDSEAELTVGGLVQSSLQKTAQVGDVVYFKNLSLAVEEMVDGGIWMVRIEKANG